MPDDPPLIDSHCHLDFPEFDDDRELIMQHCMEQNITTIVVPGVCRKDWQRLLVLCQDNQRLFPALGLHPCFLHQHQPSDLDRLARMCQTQSLVAIGEIGLDYYPSSGNADIGKDEQGRYFSEQLQLARQFQLPVLIHVRKAHEEVLRHLKTIKSVSGIIHAYSGSYEQAKEYLKLGFKLGFGGAFTYPRATKLRSLVSRLPLDAWVLETDAPDMSPYGHRGERNSPVNLSQIAQTFISLYDGGLQAKDILDQLYLNTRTILNLPQ